MAATMERPSGDDEHAQHDQTLTPAVLPQQEADQVAQRAAEYVSKWSLFRSCWPDAHDQVRQIERFKFVKWLVDTGRLTEIV